MPPEDFSARRARATWRRSFARAKETEAPPKEELLEEVLNHSCYSVQEWLNPLSPLAGSASPSNRRFNN